MFDALDLDRLLAEPTLRHVQVLASVSSTNDVAMDLAVRWDAPAPALIVAEEQTAGRGRGDHRWWSGRGGLTFSLVLNPAEHRLGQADWPRIPLVAAVAICDVLRRLAPQVPTGLKWPNDVWLDGKKVCGILAESPGRRSSAPPRLVVGLGLNVNNSLAAAPAEVRARAISLRDVSPGPWDRTQLLLDIWRQFLTHLEALHNHEPQMARRWQSYCVLAGRRIEVDLGSTTRWGLCAGIDESGALVLHTESGLERLMGGSVTSIETE